MPSSEWDVLSQVRKGDTLFLFNFQRNLLHGVFEAASDAAMNIDPCAFYGRFPVQVQVVEKMTCPGADKGALLPLIKKRLIRISHRGVLLFPRKLDNPKFVDDLYRILLRISPIRASQNRLTRYKSKDGHYTNSNAEKIIDNWLADHLPYVHDYDLSITREGRTVTCDWHVHEIDLYIEYWETSRDDLTNSVYTKHRFYEQSSLKFIDIYQEDLPELDYKIPAKILQVERNCKFRRLSKGTRRKRSS
jgi:hypothetical protein